jgi:hypothetical protein
MYSYMFDVLMLFYTFLCIWPNISTLCTMIKIAKEFLSLAHYVQKSCTLWKRVIWRAYLFINIVQKLQNSLYQVMSITCLFSIHMNISVRATFLSSLAPVSTADRSWSVVTMVPLWKFQLSLFYSRHDGNLPHVVNVTALLSNISLLLIYI